MKMKFAALALLLTVTAVPSFADDPSHHAKAEKVVSIMHVDHMMDGYFDAMKAQLPAMLGAADSAAKMTPEQKVIFDEFQSKLFGIVREELRAKLLPKMVDVYDKTFSDEELDAMYGFYSTPVGQSVLMKTPQAMQNSMSGMQDLMADMMPKIQALAEEYGPKFKGAAPSAAK